MAKILIMIVRFMIGDLKFVLDYPEFFWLNGNFYFCSNELFMGVKCFSAHGVAAEIKWKCGCGRFLIYVYNSIHNFIAQ